MYKNTNIWHKLCSRLSIVYSVLPAEDLLRDETYRRLWLSILISSFGSQITMLALPMTAVVVLKATPSQMGMLTAMEFLPLLVLSLPAGVWMERVRKLPVYVIGEGAFAATLASVPLAWYFGILNISFMYFVAFTIGCIFVMTGTAAQIVLMQVVSRDRLIEAHAKNSLAFSSAEVIGPGFAGALIKVLGAPLALMANASLLVLSVLILRSLTLTENLDSRAERHFWQKLKEGGQFVRDQPLLVSLAILMGLWQLCNQCAMVVQILFATHELGLNEKQVGLCYVGLGISTVLASFFGNRISHRIGPGPCLVLGIVLSGLGWLQIALIPLGPLSILSFVVMLVCFGISVVLLYINFLALRQIVTPEHLLGRMTSIMRWLMLIPAAPGALIGGYLGEVMGLRYSIGLGGVGALLLAVLAWYYLGMRNVRSLPHDEHVRNKN